MYARKLAILGAAVSFGLAASACNKADKPAPAAKKEAPAKKAPEAAKEAPAKKSPSGLHKHMQEHFVKADELQRAVIAGKLDDVKAHAKWLAAHDAPADLPVKYKPHAERLKAAAQKIVEAGGASEAAHGAAAMAAACANCHISRGTEISFGAEAEPKAGEDLMKSHMARHTWAVTRMWDGVVGGSAPLYAKGAAALAELPTLAISLKDGNKLMGVAADQILEQLRASAEKATKAETPEARAEVLGSVLSSCGNCHAMLAKGP